MTSAQRKTDSLVEMRGVGFVPMILASMCGFATSEGPTNVTAKLGENHGDSVDIKLEWDALPPCFWGQPPVHVYITYKNEESFVGSTKDNRFLIGRAEFWSEYIVSLKSSWWCSFPNIEIKVTTGPGNPHPPKRVTEDLRGKRLYLDIVDADEMPKPISFYEISISSDKNWDWTKKTRDTYLHLDLKPLAEYNLSVEAVIVHNNETYSSQPVFHTFNTNLEAPYIDQMKVSKNDDGAEINIYWSNYDKSYNVNHYELKIETSDGKIIWSKITTERFEKIRELPLDIDVKLHLQTVFNVGSELMKSDTATVPIQLPSS